MQRNSLVKLYSATDYRVLGGPEWVSVRIGSPSRDLDSLLAREGATCAAIVTAWNPGSQRRPEAENRAAGARLAQRLRGQGLAFLPERAVPDNSDWAPEEGHCILNLEEPQALDLALSYGQYAIVVIRRGLEPRLAFTRLAPCD